MDKAIACLNIEHYRKLLANEVDETRRHTVRRLLAEEEAKLATLKDELSRPASRPSRLHRCPLPAQKSPINVHLPGKSGHRD